MNGLSKWSHNTIKTSNDKQSRFNKFKIKSHEDVVVLFDHLTILQLDAGCVAKSTRNWLDDFEAYRKVLPAQLKAKIIP